MSLKTKIGFYMSDSGLYGVDLGNPYQGNPGVGGTQYCFLMLIYSLIKYSNFEIFIFSCGFNLKYPEGATVVQIKDIEDALRKSKALNLDFLLLKTISEPEIYDTIEKIGQKVICWSHNYILSNVAKKIAESEFIVANVFVGKQQYDRYIDHPVINKSACIFNMLTDPSLDISIDENSKIVCYMGSLVPSKGFHVLAMMWKDILKEVPDAILHVIGSGKLYTRKSKLGSLGVADAKYEEYFTPYLSENGKLLDSVKFLGILGKEKYIEFAKSAVGVVNPTARTEIFSISIMEMASMKLPVVTLNKNGFPDSILNGKTGILANSQQGIKDGIIYLLKNKSSRLTMGENAKNYIKNFTPEKILPQWLDLFENLKKGLIKQRYSSPVRPYTNNFKFIRILNRFLRFNLGLRFLPPLISVETFVYNIYRKFR